VLVSGGWLGWSRVSLLAGAAGRVSAWRGRRRVSHWRERSHVSHWRGRRHVSHWRGRRHVSQGQGQSLTPPKVSQVVGLFFFADANQVLACAAAAPRPFSSLIFPFVRLIKTTAHLR